MGPRRYRDGVLHDIAVWWDGVELWLTQLTFPVQALLVVAVVGALCWGLAALIDVVVERSVAARLAAQAQRGRGAERAPGGR